MVPVVNTTTYLIVLFVVLALSFWAGYKQKWIRSATMLAGILISRLLLTPKGAELFTTVANRLIKGVVVAIRSKMDYKEAARIAEEVRSDWINPSNQAVTLTVVAVAVIGLAYLVGKLLNKVVKTTAGLIGGILGVLCGYLLLNLFLPYLPPQLPGWITTTAPPPRGPPAPGPDLIMPAVELAEKNFKTAITLFLALILVLTALSIKPKKESGKK